MQRVHLLLSKEAVKEHQYLLCFARILCNVKRNTPTDWQRKFKKHFHNPIKIAHKTHNPFGETTERTTGDLITVNYTLLNGFLLNPQLPAQGPRTKWWMFSWKQSSRAVIGRARVRSGLVESVGTTAAAPLRRTYVTHCCNGLRRTDTYEIGEIEGAAMKNVSQRWLTARTSALYNPRPRCEIGVRERHWGLNLGHCTAAVRSEDLPESCSVRRGGSTHCVHCFPWARCSETSQRATWRVAVGCAVRLRAGGGGGGGAAAAHAPYAPEPSI